MSELSGKRVIGKKEAPRLLVLYRCPKCEVGDTFDAYDGVPSCSGDPTHGSAHPKEFMTPIRLVKNHEAITAGDGADHERSERDVSSERIELQSTDERVQ